MVVSVVMVEGDYWFLIIATLPTPTFPLTSVLTIKSMLFAKYNVCL